jgi:hypothetical protein
MEESRAMDDPDWPQPGRERMILPPPIGLFGIATGDPERELLARLDDAHVMMMGDNPALPRMPARPTVLDFIRLRCSGITGRHLLTSAARALDAGHAEKIVVACLLHDIANGGLIRSDHGYWGAQMIGPYVEEEIAWAVRYHQALRYFPDAAVGYEYPESYHRFFGPDYFPPDYIRRDAEDARRHRWYMTSRLITLYDIYFFDDAPTPDPDRFTDILARHFRQPPDGLGFDGSPVAHMWRTAIWPNNFL